MIILAIFKCNKPIVVKVVYTDTRLWATARLWDEEYSCSICSRYVDR